MISLNEIIEQLKSAEFSQNYFTDLVSKEFMPSRINDVINFVNSAVCDIHVNFLTYRGECVIQTTKGKVEYKFNDKASKTLYPDTGFILDSPEDLFTSNVLEIVSVMTLDRQPLSLNQERVIYPGTYGYSDTITLRDFKGSFITPTWGSLRVNPKLESCKLIIGFKEGGEIIQRIPIEQITEENYNIDDVYVDLPYMFLMPIVYFVTSRYANSRGTERVGQGVFNEGNNFLTKYREECADIVRNMNNNVVQADPVTIFEMNGYV